MFTGRNWNYSSITVRCRRLESKRSHLIVTQCADAAHAFFSLQYFSELLNAVSLNIYLTSIISIVCNLKHLYNLPRCQRMTAVTLNPAPMKTRFFRPLKNTTLTGPTGLTAPTATCSRPRVQTNTNHPPSTEDVSLGPSCRWYLHHSPLCQTMYEHYQSGPVLELLKNVNADLFQLVAFHHPPPPDVLCFVRSLLFLWSFILRHLLSKHLLDSVQLTLSFQAGAVRSFFQHAAADMCSGESWEL